MGPVQKNQTTSVPAGLDDPISKERLVCEAPLPPSFEKLLAALRRRA
jgi:hypothetical protein